MQRCMAAILEDVAAELAQLAGNAEDLQVQMEHMPALADASAHGLREVASRAKPVPRREDVIVALQSLDYVTQTLQCLARFVAEAASHVSPGCQADLVSALPAVWLTALRLRLGGTDAVSKEEYIELFDAA